MMSLKLPRNNSNVSLELKMSSKIGLRIIRMLRLKNSRILSMVCVFSQEVNLYSESSSISHLNNNNWLYNSNSNLKLYRLRSLINFLHWIGHLRVQDRMYQVLDGEAKVEAFFSIHSIVIAIIHLSDTSL